MSKLWKCLYSNYKRYQRYSRVCTPGSIVWDSYPLNGFWILSPYTSFCGFSQVTVFHLWNMAIIICTAYCVASHNTQWGKSHYRGITHKWDENTHRDTVSRISYERQDGVSTAEKVWLKCQESRGAGEVKPIASSNNEKTARRREDSDFFLFLGPTTKLNVIFEFSK